jgi:GntR family transcriptional regulator
MSYMGFMLLRRVLSQNRAPTSNQDAGYILPAGADRQRLTYIGPTVYCVNRLVQLAGMIIRVNSSSGTPVYMQLMEQVKHAIETGALRAGEQLPTLRQLAVELVINPNTVARAYRELERDGVVEIRHGSGAFVSQITSGRTKILRKAQFVAQSAVDRLAAAGLTEEEIRRLIESELAQLRAGEVTGRKE